MKKSWSVRALKRILRWLSDSWRGWKTKQNNICLRVTSQGNKSKKLRKSKNLRSLIYSNQTTRLLKTVMKAKSVKWSYRIIATRRLSLIRNSKSQVKARIRENLSQIQWKIISSREILKNIIWAKLSELKRKTENSASKLKTLSSLHTRAPSSSQSSNHTKWVNQNCCWKASAKTISPPPKLKLVKPAKSLSMWHKRQLMRRTSYRNKSIDSKRSKG